MVEYLSDRVIVMYLGKIMEIAPARTLYGNPSPSLHRGAAVGGADPRPQAAKRKRTILTGDIPSPINPPSGCVFRTRCPIAMPECAKVVPALGEIAPGHFKACIRDDVL